MAVEVSAYIKAVYTLNKDVNRGLRIRLGNMANAVLIEFDALMAADPDFTVISRELPVREVEGHVVNPKLWTVVSSATILDPVQAENTLIERLDPIVDELDRRFSGVLAGPGGFSERGAHIHRSTSNVER